MSKIITLRKGLDINLVGKPQETLAAAPMASEYALSPLDFEGVTPKLLVKVGDRVKAGTALFFNKFNELRTKKEKEAAAAAPAPAPAKSADIILLEEIRDLLKK